MLHNSSRIFIGDKRPDLPFPDCIITVWRRPTNIRACLPALSQPGLCLLGKILCVHVVDKVLDLRCHVLCVIPLITGVDAVRNRNEPHTKERENLLYIIARFKVIPAEPG